MELRHTPTHTHPATAMLPTPTIREREGEKIHTKTPQTAAATSPAVLRPRRTPAAPRDGREEGNKSTYSPVKSRRAKITFPPRSGPFLFKLESSRRDTQNALNLEEPAWRALPYGRQ